MEGINNGEGLEIIQDLIDRLLYLDIESKDLFISEALDLLYKYPVKCEIIDGVRTYNRI
jgi:hypothetical protein